MNTTATDRPRLLIVDDDASLLSILGWGFEDMGYEVCTASDYRQAVDAVQRMPFDFALLDYRLPDGNGHALAAYLRQQLPGLRVVLMSADRGAAVAEINGRDNASAFVEKPVRLNKLDAFFNGQTRA